MKFEIYGLSKETIDQDKWGEKQGMFLGTYDGVQFSSNEYKLEQLEDFDYIHVFINGQLKSHYPKRFNQNIREKLKRDFIREFGENIQISLL